MNLWYELQEYKVGGVQVFRSGFRTVAMPVHREPEYSVVVKVVPVV